MSNGIIINGKVYVTQDACCERSVCRRCPLQCECVNRKIKLCTPFGDVYFRGAAEKDIFHLLKNKIIDNNIPKEQQ